MFKKYHFIACGRINIKALGDDDFNINELFSKIPVMIKKDNRYVSITKEDFASQNGGYTLEVVIEIEGYSSKDH